MAADSVISIGAVVDKTAVESGLEEAKGDIVEFAKSVGIETTEITAKAARAWRQIPEAAKEAMAQVSDVQRQAAQAAIANQNAIRGVAAALRYANAAGTPYELGVRAVAGAQRAATAASVDLKTALAAVAAESKTSNAAIGISMKGIAAEVRTSALSVREAITGAFRALNDVLMVSAVAGAVGHYVDEFSKLNVELDHLSVKTGIAIEDLSGLQAMVQQAGGSWEGWATGLMRMEKNLGSLDDPSKQLSDALAGVNLQVQDLQGLNAEQALNRIAQAFAGTSDHAKVARAAVALFGRGGQELIPIMKELGGELSARMIQMVAYTGVSKESDAASKQWTEDLASLKLQLRAIGTPLVEFCDLLLHAVRATVELIRDLVLTVVKGIATVIAAAVAELIGMVDAVMEALAGHWKAAWGDLYKVSGKALSYGGGMIASDWKRFGSVMTGDDMPHVPRLAEVQGKGEDNEGDDGDPNSPSPRGDGSTSGRNGEQGAVQPGYNPLVSNLSRIPDAAEAVKRQMADLGDASVVAFQKAAAAWAGPLFPPQLFKSPLSTVTLAAQQQASEFQKIWEQSFRQLAQNFNQTVSHWIIEGGRFRQMMQHTINQVAEHFLQQTMKMAEGWAKHEILKLTKTIATQSQITAVNATGTAAATAIQKSGDAQTGLSDAKTAARNTYKVVSGWPVVGPILAPILAAGAFAAVEAFDEGGVVGKRMGLGGMGYHVPILAEAGERVLSQQQSANFERMVNQTSAATTVNNHYHDETHLSGIDGASIEGMYRNNAAAGRREFMRQMRLANQI